MLKLPTSILIFSLCFSIYAQNQKWEIETITVEDGLRSDAVTTILKDRMGFMWFGTRLGLHRYDGYELLTYTYNVAGGTHLSDNKLSDLAEDHDGNLWIATANGLNKFEPLTGQFFHFEDDPEDFKHLGSGGAGKRVYVDKNGSVWYGTLFNGLKKFDRLGETFIRYEHDPLEPSSISGNSITCIYEDQKGGFWVGSNPGGLHRMERKNGMFQPFPINTTDSMSLNNFITFLYEDQSNNFWVGTRDGLYLFNPKEISYKRVLHEIGNPNRMENQQFTALREDFQGNYWIRTYSGLYQYSQQLEKLNAWENRPHNPILAVLPNIRSLYLDSSGIVWYTNHYKGIVKLIPKNKPFRYYQNSPKLRNQGVHSVTSVALTQKDIIWMGSYGGLSRFDRKQNEYKLFQHNPRNPNSLGHNLIRKIMLDTTGNLTITAHTEGLNKLIISEDSTYKIVRYHNDPNDPGSISKGPICHIVKAHGARYYVLFYGGEVDIFDPEKETFVHLDFPLPENIKYQSYHITDILEENDKIWAASTIGLMEMSFPFRKSEPYNVAPDTIIFHESDPSNPIGLNCREIGCIYKDHNNTIWLGSFGGGLTKMIRGSDQNTIGSQINFRHYTKVNGLYNDVVTAIQEDSKGKLWIAGSGGISRFDPVTEMFTNYDLTDGLEHLDYTQIFKASNGEMFLPGAGGLLAFYPDSIEDNPIIPPIVITDFQLFNERVQVGGKSPLQKSISYATDIELPHNKNFLSFEFAALNFLHPEKNQYKYKMEGLDHDWIEAGPRRFASYPNLNPGTYTFRVKGSNDDNVWNMEGASLRITIHPPWWATYYAYASYGLLAVLCILGYVRLRTRQIRGQREKLEKLVQERMRQIEKQKEEIELQKETLEKQNRKIMELDQVKSKFFNNISHEFRTPLTLIQGPVEDLLSNARLKKNEINKLNMINRSAKRLLNLVNQLLDISKLKSGMMKLKLVNGDIFHHIRIITNSFSSLAETKGIIYNRFIPIGKYNTWFDLGILEKVIVNLLSNAFKFTPEGGEIKFSTRWFHGASMESPDVLELSVSDQGPGISEEDKDKIFTRFYQVENEKGKTSAGSGIGLSLVRDLVDLNHGSIQVQSNLGKGSVFTVNIPLGMVHLKHEEYIIQSQENKEKQLKPDNYSEETDFPKEIIHEPKQKKNGEKPIILIIDDNSDIRRHIFDNLENDYQIAEAINGSAGLKKALEIIPDLIISDLIMPGVDGIEFCRKIKSDECTSHIPIIMLTAKSSLDEKMEGLETGADDYITKPFDMKELKIRISNLIEQRRKLREHYSSQITLEPKEINITSLDEAFLQRAKVVVEERMADETLDVERFQDAMNMSHSTLFRKLQALTGQSPTMFIRNIRLRRAAQLLRDNYGNIAKVSYEVGFNNPAYFSKCFKSLFGISPMEYMHKTPHKV